LSPGVDRDSVHSPPKITGYPRNSNPAVVIDIAQSPQKISGTPRNNAAIDDQHDSLPTYISPNESGETTPSNIILRAPPNIFGTIGSTSDSIQIERTVKTVNFQQNTCFLSKPLGKPRSKSARGVNDKVKRRHETFIKIKLTKLSSDILVEQEKEAANTFKDLVTCLWKLDPDLLVWPWDSEKARIPLHRKNKLNFPTTKATMSEYVDYMFLNQSNAPWFRVFIGHNKRISMLEDETFQEYLQSKDMLCYVEKVQ
jgi:hypothetical protein